MRNLSRSARLSVAVLAVLTAAVALPLLLPGEPGTVHARKYGYHHKKYSYGAQIAKCRGYCTKKAGLERGCAKRAAKAGLRACIQAFKGARADCAGDGTCKREAVGSFQSCKSEGRRQFQADLRAINGRGYAPACGKCCQRTRGSGSCTSYLAGSRWYNSYKTYGKLRCVQGSSSGAFLPGMTDTVRGWLAQLVPFLVRDWSS